MLSKRGWLAFCAIVGCSSAAFGQVDTIFGPGGSVTSTTGPVNVTQNSNVNEIGVLQVGGNPVANINQTGFYNRSVVVQFGGVNTTTVIQNGNFNRSFVVQFSTPPNNNAGVAQTGPFNFSTIVQNTGTMPPAVGVYVQNLLEAPETIAMQADLSQIAALRFSRALFDELDSAHWRACTPSAPPPQRMIVKAPKPAPQCPQWSIFWNGSYGNGNWDDRVGATGFSYDLYAVNGGIEYRFNQNFLMGLAANFTRTNADLNHSLGSTGLDSSQIGFFASYMDAGYFLDGALTWGFNNYLVTRPGFTSSVTASPGGNSFTAAARGGYLFDLGFGRLGPIAGITYARSNVDAYSENGDPLLTQSVSAQSVDALIGSGGAQFRVPYLMWQTPVISYINVTAERDFHDGNMRTIGSTFTQAPGTQLVTPVLNPGGTFGRVQGGVNFYVTPSMTALITAESTFAQSGQREFAVNTGLKLSF
jgi:outer membrane lipase/esterase